MAALFHMPRRDAVAFGILAGAALVNLTLGYFQIPRNWYVSAIVALVALVVALVVTVIVEHYAEDRLMQKGVGSSPTTEGR